MKLSYAIIISLFGHGVVLMSWPHLINLSVASAPSSYQVILLAQQTNKTTNKKTAAKDKITKNHKKSKIIEEKISHTSQKKETFKTKSHQNFNPKAYVISHIRYEIKNHFVYPMLARRNGWQGKVILSLYVNSQGSIENAHVKVSSGHRILDNSALKALIKVKRIHNIKKWNYLNQHELIIPIIYQLQKG